MKSKNKKAKRVRNNAEIKRLREVIEEDDNTIAKLYNELRERENDIEVISKYAKHFFSPSENDNDVCAKCGNNFRDIRLHFTGK